MRARSVRRPSTGVRSSLKSPLCSTTPWGVCTAMAWACGTLCVTGMNSTSNGPICTPFVVGDDAQLRVAEEPGLLDAVAGESERHRRAVDRHLDLAQQVLQGADVVLVAVGGDDGDDAPGVLAQVREVGEHEVDAVHVRVGEHQPAVDEQDLAIGTVARRTAAELDRHAVAADLAEAAEEDDADGVAPGRSVRRRRRPGQPRAATNRPYTSAARGSNQSGSGPSGGRQRPAGWPRWRSIAFEGSGFGASSPVSKA